MVFRRPRMLKDVYIQFKSTCLHFAQIEKSKDCSRIFGNNRMSVTYQYSLRIEMRLKNKRPFCSER